MISHILKERPDVIGFTVMTPTFEVLKRIVAKLRERSDALIIGAALMLRSGQMSSYPLDLTSLCAARAKGQL